MKPKKDQANPPSDASLEELKTAAQTCTGCSLYKNATQTVFGEGPQNSKLMVIGEQPGNKEDLSGMPFVGQAGTMLDQLCRELGIPRPNIYVTNAVKHFKWQRAGKFRLHKKPSTSEVNACRPWLKSEIKVIRPKVILCMGTTAAMSVFGRAIPIGASRGQILQSDLADAQVILTWHPSAILRSPTPETRAEKRKELKDDLSRAWSLAQSRP